MAAAVAEVKEEWQLFRDDKPGERFSNHRERMRRKSRKHVAVSMALGVLLLAVGTVLLFFPGPGIPLIVFGVALVASHSKRLAHLLDRAEPRLRDYGHRMRAWWHDLTREQRAAIITSVVVVAAVGVGGMWKWVIAAYVL